MLSSVISRPLTLLLPLLAAPTTALSPRGPDGDAERLERALRAVREEALRGDVSFLAADEMAGRDTPSHELLVAALYLRARLERLGFRTPGPEGYFHDYLLFERRLDVERSGLVIQSGARSEHLAFGRDYFLARLSHMAERETAGQVVSVGRGSREDFQATRLEGCWALVFDRGVSLRRTLRYAEKRGAIGILFVRSSEATDRSKPYAERFASITRLLVEPRLSNRPAGDLHLDEPAVVMLDRRGANALLSMAAAEWTGEVPPSGLQLGVHALESRTLVRRETPVPNVAGFWPGSDPELGHEVIVVSAHFDHVGTRGADIYNGADDNASGTTGLLGIAQALAAYGPMRRSVLLLWLSGEEKGLWGSSAWTQAPYLPAGCVLVADLNLDMIGRTAPDELYVTPTPEHEAYNSLARAAYELAALEGFSELRSQDQDWARSDHFLFDRHLAVPVVFLSAGDHADYHKPTDTAEKIDYGKMARVTRLVVRMLVRVQSEPIERL